MMGTRRRGALVAVLVALPFTVAACSSSASGGSRPGANAPVGQAAATSGSQAADQGGSGGTGGSGGSGGTGGSVGTGGSLGGSGSRACSLISQDQAKAALGDDVAPGVEQRSRA